jgi:predicted nucleotidyltransferase
MDRQTIVDQLRKHTSEIRQAGVVHLSLFGSAARDEMRHDSDIDLMVDFDPSARVTLVTLGRLQYDLSKMLGVSVDISSEAWMHEAVRKQALSEARLVF